MPYLEGNKLAWKDHYIVGARLGKAHVAGKLIARNRWVGWVEKNGAGSWAGEGRTRTSETNRATL